VKVCRLKEANNNIEETLTESAKQLKVAGAYGGMHKEYIT
jgi:hypothetical protein